MSDVDPLNAAATVPDITVFFRRYEAASIRARERFIVHRDLAYGSSAAEKLDLFPAGPGSPLALFFHGGYWRRLDKSDFSFIAKGLVPLGVSVASVNYGLAPAVPLHEIVAQCRRAVDWLAANSPRFDLDAERISVCGHSAGGHLAAMCAVTRPVRAVVTLSGLHDLRPIQRSFVNEWLALDEFQAWTLSPIQYAPARACHIVATAGEHESDAFKAQGRALVDAWASFGCAGAYTDSPGDNHFTICERLDDPNDPLSRQIAALAH